MPLSDPDGAYTVSWGTWSTTGVTYVLEEATDAAFTTGKRTAYTGTADTVNITGRKQGVTYYYRVIAKKSGMCDSLWTTHNSMIVVNGVQAISSGQGHTLALMADHTVYAWGENRTRQLADNTEDFRTSPAQIQGLADVAQVEAGAYFSVVLKDDGTIWTWGANWDGQLGIGSNELVIAAPQKVTRSLWNYQGGCRRVSCLSAQG